MTDPSPFHVRLMALDRAIQTLVNDSSQSSQARCAAIVQTAEYFAEFLNPTTDNPKPSRQHSGGQKVNIRGGEPLVPPGEYTLLPKAGDLPPATDDLAREDLDAPKHRLTNVNTGRSRSATYNDHWPAQTKVDPEPSDS